MSNITITDIDVGAPILGEAEFTDATLVFGGADTWAPGTLMGEKLTSADSYAGTPTGTGDRVTALTARAGRALKVGAYTLVAGTLTSGAGEWTMTDPDGITETYTTAAAGEDMEFPSLGVDVSVADTGTNYVTADSVAFTVVTGSRWVPFVGTGVNGEGNPSGVLTYEVVATGAGNIAARVMIAGRVKKERLLIDAGGTVTAAILAALRTNGVVAIATEQLGAYDNS